MLSFSVAAARQRHPRLGQAHARGEEALSLKHRILRATNRAVRPLGVKIVRAVDRTRLHEVLDWARRKGLRPRTVIDVGVAYGTPDLYAAFPDAGLLLIEPLQEWEPAMRALAETRGARYAVAAAGASVGSVAINVPKVLSWATLGPSAHECEVREVPMTTVDEQVRIHRMEGPYLLKVDVEGFESSVIEGAAGTCANCEAVILETWLDSTFVELVGLMAARGFTPHDMFDFGYRPSDGVLEKVDVLFVRSGGRLRTGDYGDEAIRSVAGHELRLQGRVTRTPSPGAHP